MSVQDLPPELDELTAEPEDLTVRRLVRAIDYAEGFWLGFAKSNTPAQRRRLAALCRDLLEPLKIRVLEIELNEPVTDLLPVLRERLSQERASNDVGDAPSEAATTARPKLAIFVHGLERSIPSREAHPPLLSSLNLKRELFRQEVPHPLLLWLPDYALTALARKAPDFWAWRSGLYEFAPEREAAEQSLAEVRGQDWYTTTSLSERAKRERIVVLKGLLDDYLELGDGSREQEAQANILKEIGLAHGFLGDLTESKRAYKEALQLYRHLNDEAGEAEALTLLGWTAQQEGPEESGQLYNESLKISKRLGDKEGIASSLYYLGMLSRVQGNFEDALRLYSESLKISREMGHQGGIAVILSQLGMLAQAQGEMENARRLYKESLEMSKVLGDQEGIALNLYHLGTLSESEGDNEEAARLFHEALGIFDRLGSPNAEIARRSLARV